MRVAHLALYLPWFFALFFIVRRFTSPLIAAGVLLFASAVPLTAYYGPMVVQDGATMSFGAVTLAAFFRHLERRTWRSWLLVATSFFVTASMDFPGYWWGLAMLAAVVLAHARRQAFLVVCSLFPVAVAAFAILAVHYGIMLGGPAGYVEKLLATVKHDGDRVIWSGLASVVDDLLIPGGNWPAVGLASLGVVTGAWSRSPTARRLTYLGLALLVPGVLNVVTMPHHFASHVFWPMHGFAGVACLAIAGVFALHKWTKGRRSSWRTRIVGGVAVLVLGASIGYGVIKTHELIHRYRNVGTRAERLVSAALPHLEGCPRTMVSTGRSTLQFVGHTQIFAGVDTAEELEIALALGRRRDLRGFAGFVPAPEHVGPALPRRLDQIAVGREVDGALAYRVKL